MVARGGQGLRFKTRASRKSDAQAVLRRWSPGLSGCKDSERGRVARLGYSLSLPIPLRRSISRFAAPPMGGDLCAFLARKSRLTFRRRVKAFAILCCAFEIVRKVWLPRISRTISTPSNLAALTIDALRRHRYLTRVVTLGHSSDQATKGYSRETGSSRYRSRPSYQHRLCG